jgi:hypothetical protein
MSLPKIDVPVFETNLISTGKSVRFRPFLVKEQKLFLMAAQSDDAKDVTNAIKQVLKNCILDDKVDVDKLPTFDLENLFLNLRARSVGEIANLRYTCNNIVKDDEGKDKSCGGLVKVDVNLLEIAPTKNSNHTDKIALSDKLGVCMKYPNFDMIDKLNKKDNVDILNLIASCIDYVYDDEKVYYAKDVGEKEMIDFIENLQQVDLEKIQKFFETMPKLTKDFDFKCPKCGYGEKVTIEGVQNFFA